MRLTAEQQRLVEDNLGLVVTVLNDCVADHHNHGYLTNDDFIQLGRIGLCKAASTYNPNGAAQFSTYAYILIRNEIYRELEKSSIRMKRATIVDPDDAIFKHSSTGQVADSDLVERLSVLAATSSETVSKGIRALQLQVQGFSCQEIGLQFGGAPANHVSAWIARAKKSLRQDPAIIALMQ